jgi:hypothetical protein
MRAGGDDDPAFSAGFDVDVPGAASGLTNDFEVRQALDEFARKPAALADRHDCFCGLQPPGEIGKICCRFPVTYDLVAIEQAETAQRVHEILIVVRDRDSHERFSSLR